MLSFASLNACECQCVELRATVSAVARRGSACIRYHGLRRGSGPRGRRRGVQVEAAGSLADGRDRSTSRTTSRRLAHSRPHAGLIIDPRVLHCACPACAAIAEAPYSKNDYKPSQSRTVAGQRALHKSARTSTHTKGRAHDSGIQCSSGGRRRRHNTDAGYERTHLSQRNNTRCGCTAIRWYRGNSHHASEKRCKRRGWSGGSTQISIQETCRGPGTEEQENRRKGGPKKHQFDARMA